MQKPEYDFDTVLKGSAEHLSVLGVEQCPVTYLSCCGSGEKGGIWSEEGSRRRNSETQNGTG
jgi:hypothetical protein